MNMEEKEEEEEEEGETGQEKEGRKEATGTDWWIYPHISYSEASLQQPIQLLIFFTFPQILSSPAHSSTK